MTPRAARSGLLFALGCLATACGAGEDARSAGGARRVLVVGWDGASFRFVDRLVAQGRLPNVAALLERGASAELESTAIPISSAAWAALSTGRWPGETGVYSFFEPLEGSYDARLVSALSNRATPIWRILTRRGLGVNVVGVPVTYPPERVNGTLVGGMLSPSDATYTHPPELADALRARGFEPDLERWIEDREPTWERFDRQLELLRELVLELLAEDDWRLSWVVFKSLDVACHRAPGADFEAFVDPIYERLDRILGELLAAAGPETDVLLVSDHGFRTYERAFDLHAWLLATGFAAAKGAPAGAPVPDTIYATAFARERRALLDDLDLSRTRALAATCEGSFGSLRLNLSGREPQGVVPPEQASLVLEALERELISFQLPEGCRLVRNVWRSAALYPGPEQRLLPDLIFEVDERTKVFARPARAVLERLPVPIPDHDRLGILVAAGPSFAARRERGWLTLVDVAPTVLALLGLPVYEELDGAVALELLRVPLVPRRVPEADDPQGAPGAGPAASPFTEAQRAELEARLRALGYGG